MPAKVHNSYYDISDSRITHDMTFVEACGSNRGGSLQLLGGVRLVIIYGDGRVQTKGEDQKMAHQIDIDQPLLDFDYMLMGNIPIADGMTFLFGSAINSLPIREVLEPDNRGNPQLGLHYTHCMCNYGNTEQQCPPYRDSRLCSLQLRYAVHTMAATSTYPRAYSGRLDQAVAPSPCGPWQTL